MRLLKHEKSRILSGKMYAIFIARQDCDAILIWEFCLSARL